MHPLNVHQRVCGRRRNLTEFRTFQVATLVLVGTICAATIVSPAQNPPLASTSAVTELVSSLAEPFKHLKAKSVVVLDFRGADGKEGPVGKWLADQISVAIEKQFAKLHTIPRSQLGIENSSIVSTDPDALFLMDVKQARAVGADVYVTGNFAKISESQIGLSVTIVGLKELEKTHETRTAIIPISKDIANLSTEPIPGLDLERGIPRAGKGGISMPICTHCPQPQFPRNQSKSGVVKLEIVVTTDGRAGTVTVVTAPTPEMAASAVRAVQTWRFKPSLGFDGNPIETIVPIECDFQVP